MGAFKSDICVFITSSCKIQILTPTGPVTMLGLSPYLLVSKVNKFRSKTERGTSKSSPSYSQSQNPQILIPENKSTPKLHEGLGFGVLSTSTVTVLPPVLKAETYRFSVIPPKGSSQEYCLPLASVPNSQEK